MEKDATEYIKSIEFIAECRSKAHSLGLKEIDVEIFIAMAQNTFLQGSIFEIRRHNAVLKTQREQRLKETAK